MAQEDEDRRILRHEQAAEPTFSGGDADLIEAVDDHVTEHFGAPSNVFHELVSPYVHVDVHVVEPTDERPVYTLVTSRMAERPMQSPFGERYAELMLLLPPDWPDVRSSGAPEEAMWPFRLLQTLAQLPHEFETFLDAGHTIPNGDPPEPYAPGTGLCCALVMPPLMAPEEAWYLEAGGRKIQLFAVVPLHEDEMQLKLDNDLDVLLDALDDAQVSEVLQPDRPSAIRRRRGLFHRR